MNPNNNESTLKETDVDILRDTPVRYIGYSNEVGEAFRSLVSPNVVKASYALAFGYVLIDVFDKAKKTYALESKVIAKPDQESAESKTLKSAADCLIWQTFATVLIPGFTINRICKLSSILLNKSTSKSILRSSKLLTTGIGFLSIPFIIYPIDHMCHVVMDKTIRPAFGIEKYYKED